MPLSTKGSWLSNQQTPLSITLNLPGSVATFPTLCSRTVLLLKLKDVSPNLIEQKCSKLQQIIHNSIFDLFSNELVTGSLEVETLSPIGNGQRGMVLDGPKDQFLRNGGMNKEEMNNLSNSSSSSVSVERSPLRGEGRESSGKDSGCKCGSKPRRAPKVPGQCVCGRKTT